MSNTLHTVDELIAALGGPSEVAEWAGLSNHSAVSQWRQRGIPPGWHLRLLAECIRRGLRLDLVAVFGLTEDEAEALLSGPRGGADQMPARVDHRYVRS